MSVCFTGADTASAGKALVYSAGIFLKLRLIEALELINREPGASGTLPFQVFLVCGFTPLHLSTFLQAQLTKQIADRLVSVRTGRYGDLYGNLRGAIGSDADAIALPLEWQDLDPRLGIRRLGGWLPESTGDILTSVRNGLLVLEMAVAEAGPGRRIAISPPTLPLPPFSHEPGWQAGGAELALRSEVAAFLERVAAFECVRIMSVQTLDRISPADSRLDIKSEIGLGFPYTTGHAAAMGGLMSRLLWDAPPKKGLITDLDDTLWRGILGEIGVDGVCWSLEKKAHAHGLYQQYLQALAARGVLTAAVSKNDPRLVEKVFETRGDLLIGASSLYPVEAGWGRKSEAVGRVLKAWNIAADSVVFVDDSPLELDEVRATWPAIETFRFPSEDPAAVWELIGQLQDRFGKARIRDEDRIRLTSLRTGAEFAAVGAGAPGEDEFLSRVQAVVTVDTTLPPRDGRALELINKTNQFNLNGRRITEGQWFEHLANPDAFLLVVSYRDKFGPLGKIAVLTGTRTEGIPRVTSWVMSCRAFSRRIEYQCLRALFNATGAEEIELDYARTERNGPVSDLLSGFGLTGGPLPVRIARAAFDSDCPQLFHLVEGAANGSE